jgi:hypothetical protein
LLLAASIIRLIALMMGAASTSETTVNFYQTTRRNNAKNSQLHTRRRENIKFRLSDLFILLQQNPEAQHRFFQSPPLGTILSQLHPPSIFTSY